MNIDQYPSILIRTRHNSRFETKSILISIDQSRSILINIDQYRSILIRTRHNSRFEAESVTLVKKSFDQY